ncbi:hypothetical protein SDC9_123440 [bioreactor metagenome]|uniref:EF-hand domain-containing protein n=1 Tax=bioreactor metagenome TaxID=1076179 RepID=A0A645CHS5_9ZZZZ
MGHIGQQVELSCGDPVQTVLPLAGNEFQLPGLGRSDLAQQVDLDAACPSCCIVEDLWRIFVDADANGSGRVRRR